MDQTTDRTRVAVVVFADVDGGLRGAHHVVARLIEQKLDQQEHTVPLAGGHGRPITVRVASVMEAGAALGNGYLWAQPTARAFQDAGLTE